jgi:peptidoglycan/LPS O-acetylase OafA/YrhL
MALVVTKLAYSAPHLAKKVLNENDISYGLYIYHMPVVNVLLFCGARGLLWVPAVWMMTAAIASMSWFGIEKPALSLKKPPNYAPPRGKDHVGEETLSQDLELRSDVTSH